MLTFQHRPWPSVPMFETSRRTPKPNMKRGARPPHGVTLQDPHQSTSNVDQTRAFAIHLCTEKANKPVSKSMKEKTSDTDVTISSQQDRLTVRDRLHGARLSRRCVAAVTACDPGRWRRPRKAAPAVSVLFLVTFGSAPEPDDAFGDWVRRGRGSMPVIRSACAGGSGCPAPAAIVRARPAWRARE